MTDASASLVYRGPPAPATEGETNMRYMMLIHHDDEALTKAGPEMASDYAAFTQAIEKAGVAYQSGLRLAPGAKATSVRVRGGKAEVLDGPYADTREQLAGYFLIDVPGIDQAIEWANRCPSARYGVIEVRPVMEHDASSR